MLASASAKLSTTTRGSLPGRKSVIPPIGSTQHRTQSSLRCACPKGQSHATPKPAKPAKRVTSCRITHSNSTKSRALDSPSLSSGSTDSGVEVDGPIPKGKSASTRSPCMASTTTKRSISSAPVNVLRSKVNEDELYNSDDGEDGYESDKSISEIFKDYGADPEVVHNLHSRDRTHCKLLISKDSFECLDDTTEVERLRRHRGREQKKHVGPGYMRKIRDFPDDESLSNKREIDKSNTMSNSLVCQGCGRQKKKRGDLACTHCMPDVHAKRRLSTLRDDFIMNGVTLKTTTNAKSKKPKEQPRWQYNKRKGSTIGNVDLDTEAGISEEAVRYHSFRDELKPELVGSRNLYQQHFSGRSKPSTLQALKKPNPKNYLQAHSGESRHWKPRKLVQSISV